VVKEFKNVLRSQLSDVFQLRNLDRISVRIKNISNFKKRERLQSGFDDEDSEPDKKEANE